MIIIKTTTSNIENAEKIASALIEKRLSVCVKINEIKSIYEWKGAIQSKKEFEISIKTVKENYEKIEKFILESHEYKLPQIYSIKIENSYVEYEKWIRSNSL